MVGLYYSASILAGRVSAPYVLPLVQAAPSEEIELQSC